MICQWLEGAYPYLFGADGYVLLDRLDLKDLKIG
jgi:hypothetical protein